MMNHVRIRKIWQKNNEEFSIEWSDGCTMDYRLSDLQEKCPCAGCSERVSHANLSKKEVRATRISNVGRYALRIQFTSGCSNGIFDFNFLRNFSHAK